MKQKCLTSDAEFEASLKDRYESAIINARMLIAAALILLLVTIRGGFLSYLEGGWINVLSLFTEDISATLVFIGLILIAAIVGILELRKAKGLKAGMKLIDDIGKDFI